MEAQLTMLKWHLDTVQQSGYDQIQKLKKYENADLLKILKQGEEIANLKKKLTDCTEVICCNDKYINEREETINYMRREMDELREANHQKCEKLKSKIASTNELAKGSIRMVVGNSSVDTIKIGRQAVEIEMLEKILKNYKKAMRADEAIIRQQAEIISDLKDQILELSH